jgi:septal ring factor EnvC (AmiA/AmiB activator)
MIRLARLVPAWLWLALAASLLFGAGWLRLQQVEAERDRAIAQLEASRGEMDALEKALTWRREQAQRQAAALAEREQALALADETIRAHRDALAQLERDDAETRDWAAEPVPDAVAEWLQRLAGPDGKRADPGDADHP